MITNADYRRQRAALTRALNSGDPLKVLATVRATVAEWGTHYWPDEWHRWRTAAVDALAQLRRDLNDTGILD